MKAFLVLTVLLLVLPMLVLNPLGRPAFLGYYAGILATWAVFAIALSKHPASPAQTTPIAVSGGQ